MAQYINISSTQFFKEAPFFFLHNAALFVPLFFPPTHSQPMGWREPVGMWGEAEQGTTENLTLSLSHTPQPIRTSLPGERAQSPRCLKTLRAKAHKTTQKGQPHGKTPGSPSSVSPNQLSACDSGHLTGHGVFFTSSYIKNHVLVCVCFHSTGIHWTSTIYTTCIVCATDMHETIPALVYP